MRDSRPGPPNTIEILGLLQLAYDKGSYVLSSFNEWENNHAEPLTLFVEWFQDYLSFLAERVVVRLEELAAQAKALGPMSPQQGEDAEKTDGPGQVAGTAATTHQRNGQNLWEVPWDDQDPAYIQTVGQSSRAIVRRKAFSVGTQQKTRHNSCALHAKERRRVSGSTSSSI